MTDFDTRGWRVACNDGRARKPLALFLQGRWAMVMRPLPVNASSQAPDPWSTPEALETIRAVVRDELARTRLEARADLARARPGAILLGVAVALFIVALSMFDLAVVLAIGGTVGSALVIAFIVVAEVLVLGYLGYRRLPKVLLGSYRDGGGDPQRR